MPEVLGNLHPVLTAGPARLLTDKLLQGEGFLPHTGLPGDAASSKGDAHSGSRLHTFPGAPGKPGGKGLGLGIGLNTHTKMEQPVLNHSLSYGAGNCVPQKRYLEVSTPSTSECDLMWKDGLHGGDQVKTRS